jgi:hypothetical protein
MQQYRDPDKFRISRNAVSPAALAKVVEIGTTHVIAISRRTGCSPRRKTIGDPVEIEETVLRAVFL